MRRRKALRISDPEHAAGRARRGEKPMQSVFEHWKYIFKNLWFVLPFAVTPAVFLALSVDFSDIELVAKSFFTGTFGLKFFEIFRAWSFLRLDSALGVIYSVLAVVCLVFFTSLLLGFVEKHMRIGKRTLSGVFSQLGSRIGAFIGIVLLFFALYELWALLLSAVLFAVSAIKAKALACFLFTLACLLFIGALFFLVSVFYLWLPCMQLTGFGAYNAFLYSYRLVIGVRWKLILSLAISYVPCFVILVGVSFGPDWLAGVIAFILFAFLYLSFCVRMETLYFETDKLDREDLLRSYREL